jgi:hypothetical protein
MTYQTINDIPLKYSQIINTKATGITSSIISVYRTNYSITMWIYLNPQPNSNVSYKNETPIFSYGIKSNYHPKLTYSNNMTGSLSNPDMNAMYNIYYSNTKKYIQVSAPFQKWNFFVFNYNLNGLDVFVNGELVNSVIFNEPSTIPIYSNEDKINVGSDNGFVDADRGLDGSICNIHYYQVPLTKYQIVNDYNLLMSKNPPIHI